MTKNREIPAPPIGELFSRVYSAQGGPAHESISLRRRLGAYVQHDLFNDHWDLCVYLKKEIGCGPEQVSAGNSLYHKYEEYFAKLPRDLLLNVITLVWRFLSAKHKAPRASPSGPWEWESFPANEWHAFVSRALREENVGYILDEQCGVRYAVDTQFDLQRASVLQCLGSKRYAAVLTAFEDAHRYFAATPQDLKAALRSLFESIEILVKLMVRTDRLTAKVVSTEIKALMLKVYGGDAVAQRAIGRTIEGFADWVDGLHYYRHGQGEEEPVSPPETFAIYAMSSGAAFLRWLMQADESSQAAASDGP